MLTAPLRAGATTALFVVAILVGSLLAMLVPDAAENVSGLADPLILLLVGVLFFTLRVDGLAALRRAPRTVLVAVGLNFLVIPLIAVTLTSTLPDEALRLGVLLYCLAPCTDWFLGFTRLAGGDTATGAALIPVQLTLQLLLYPVWLALFAGERVQATIADTGPALLTWFVLPAVIGPGARMLLGLILPGSGPERVADAADRAVPVIIAAVITAIFAGNVRTILADPGAFAGVLIVVFLFFGATCLLGEGASRLFRMRRPEHALVTMSISARNAPLMLAMTTIALPDQPVVQAAIILGMLIEFPHLTVLTHLLRRRDRSTASSRGARTAVAAS